MSCGSWCVHCHITLQVDAPGGVVTVQQCWLRSTSRLSTCHRDSVLCWVCLNLSLGPLRSLLARWVSKLGKSGVNLGGHSPQPVDDERMHRQVAWSNSVRTVGQGTLTRENTLINWHAWYWFLVCKLDNLYKGKIYHPLISLIPIFVSFNQLFMRS